MALNSKENFGKPISQELSDYLRRYTGSDERAEISIKTNIGTSTIRDVMYRHNSLTVANYPAIEEMMRIAIKNCENNIIKSSEAKKKLTKILNEL